MPNSLHLSYSCIGAGSAAATASLSRHAVHLEALRWLQSSPLSPAQLQRRVGARTAKLRQLLQAGSLTGPLERTSVAAETGQA